MNSLAQFDFINTLDGKISVNNHIHARLFIYGAFFPLLLYIEEIKFGPT